MTEISAEERARNYFVGFYCGNDICEDDDWERTIQELAREFKAYGKQERNAARREDIVLLDEGWNCNCVEDESLGRSVCECADNPANKFGIRELIEE